MNYKDDDDGSWAWWAAIVKGVVCFSQHENRYNVKYYDGTVQVEVPLEDIKSWIDYNQGGGGKGEGKGEGGWEEEE